MVRFFFLSDIHLIGLADFWGGENLVFVFLFWLGVCEGVRKNEYVVRVM